MQIAIFGGTGRTGEHVVREALARGHQARVLVRSRQRAEHLLPVDDARLSLVEGSLLDPAAVAATVAGSAAVIDVSGPLRESPKDLRQRGVAAILDALRTHGVDRFVTLTGAGVEGPGDRPKAVDRMFRYMLRRRQPDLLADSVAATDAVRASDVRWTIVRAPRLTDDPPKGDVRVAPALGPDTGIKMGRADLAAFLLDEVEQDRHVGGLPVVSW